MSVKIVMKNTPVNVFLPVFHWALTHALLSRDKDSRYKNTLKLENMAINDVLPLMVIQRDAMFWSPDTPATQFRYFYLHLLCGATLFDSHHLHLHRIVWKNLVWPRLLISVCDAWQRSMPNAELTRCGQKPQSHLIRLWTKVYAVFGTM